MRGSELSSHSDDVVESINFACISNVIAFILTIFTLIRNVIIMCVQDELIVMATWLDVSMGLA